MEDYCQLKCVVYEAHIATIQHSSSLSTSVRPLRRYLFCPLFLWTGNSGKPSLRILFPGCFWGWACLLNSDRLILAFTGRHSDCCQFTGGLTAMRQWHLLFTKPHKEPQVNRLLQQRDIETFFPVVQLERGYGRGIRVEPFFPHYLFFHTDLQSAEASGLQWLAGVRAIVHFGGRSAVVPEEVIVELRARLQPYEEQVVHPGEWRFHAGQEVEIVKGPFAGLEAIFQKGLNGKDRVQVLLHVLGAWNRVELGTSDIVPIDQRKRR